MQLFWEKLHVILKDHLEKADDHLYIMSPFISKGVLDSILPAHISATIITTWSPNYLRQQPDSLDVYKECLGRGNVALYLNDRLHAKLYASDLTKKSNSALIGSANLTRKGLGVDAQPNYEILCKLENLSPKDRIYFQRILNESVFVTDDIFKQYQLWALKYLKMKEDTVSPSIDLLIIDQLLVTDLPLTDSPSRLWDLKSNLVEFQWWEEDSLIHDLSIYGGENSESKEQFFDELKTGFLKQPFVEKLLKIIDYEGIYFGRIKQWLQDNCQDVPTPKRRELTDTTQALLRWIVDLLPDKYEVIRPQHSECLRLKH